MAIPVFSTGLKAAVSGRRLTGSNKLLTDTVEFTANQILDPGKLAAFRAGDFVHASLGSNDDIENQVITGDVDQLTFTADAWTPQASGTSTLIQKPSSGSLLEVMKNGTLHIYGSPMGSSADEAEGVATLLAILTKNGGAFTPGESSAGFSMELSGAGLVKAIDPLTGVEETVSGAGLVEGTPTWGRWYDNVAVQGASTTAVRMDGQVSTSSSAFFTISTSIIKVGSPISLISINLDVSN